MMQVRVGRTGLEHLDPVGTWLANDDVIITLIMPGKDY